MAALWLVLCGAVTTVRAAEGDTPTARVGQLAFVGGGGARMLVEGSPDWTAAAVNTPVVAHMALATEAASRAEIRIGSASLWLAPSSQLGVPMLDDRAVGIDLVHGRLVLRLPALAPADRYSLTAEGARITVSAPGAYRVEIEARRRRAVFYVLQGQAQVTLDRGELTLGADQWAAVDTRTQALIEKGAGIQRVPLDDLAERRDRRSERSVALTRLPAEMTGADALEGQGSWHGEPGYGPVWYPNGLALDWAPYRYGHWVWLPPWGWNWVDDASWGFAPTHYGRWVFLGGRWGWAPGQSSAALFATRPVYAPALVGFYGHADGAAWTPAAAGTAVVGWYPLAPGEVYWPAYSSDLAYARSLNAASVADPGAMRAWPDAHDPIPAQRYARTSFAATVVPEAAFRALQPVAAHLVAMAPAALAQAPLSALRAPPRWTGGTAVPALPPPTSPPSQPSQPSPRAAQRVQPQAQAARPHPQRPAANRPLHPKLERAPR